jgi:hypothetical protein
MRTHAHPTGGPGHEDLDDTAHQSRGRLLVRGQGPSPARGRQGLTGARTLSDELRQTNQDEADDLGVDVQHTPADVVSEHLTKLAATIPPLKPV